MSEERLRERVHSLAMRLPGLGVGPDIYALTLCELVGVYRFLMRLECGG